MDYQKLIEQFKGTENIEFLNEVRSFNGSPDELFYEIQTTDGIYYIFEVDYIGDFKSHVLEVIEEQIGKFQKIFEVKYSSAFEEAEPVKRANVYMRPNNWEEIGKYANDKYGSAPYYFNFLVKK